MTGCNDQASQLEQWKAGAGAGALGSLAAGPWCGHDVELKATGE